MVTFPAAKFSSAEALISAFDWWREAGLDYDFADTAQDWLARPEPEAPPAVASSAEPPRKIAAPPPPPRARIGGDPAHWPQDLASFQSWWMSEPSLDDGLVDRRVVPHGPAGAELMVMVDHPEADDTDRLLAGPRGRLLGQILRALGIEPENVYFASALPRHMPMPDWAALDAAGLGELTRHHLTLAAPRRVIGFGANVSSLLGHAPAKSAQSPAQICRLGADVPALIALELESLASRPRAKANFWQALLEWQSA